MGSPTATPYSHHTADPTLRAFLASDFDPTAYLNRILPALSVSPNHHSQPQGQVNKAAQPLSLKDLASQTQSHVVQLSAQMSRLSDTLTHLTDDILRNGTRLAYEVEILRGEAISLSEAVTGELNGDIPELAPKGLSATIAANPDSAMEYPPPSLARDGGPTTYHSSDTTEPSALGSLRTLHHVRGNLQAVIKVFDDALNWPLPPSALTLSSSIISVSGPQENGSLEEKGQEASKRFRDEISALLAQGGIEGVLVAEEKVQTMRDLVGVWKGTAEERARGKFVETLAQAVVERRKEEETKGGMTRKTGPGTSARLPGEMERYGQRSNISGGPGFLRRLREEIYIE